jgi:hypothetical protein
MKWTYYHPCTKFLTAKTHKFHVKYISLNYLYKKQELHSESCRNTSLEKLVCGTFNNTLSVALQALTNLGRLSSHRWHSFPTAPDGTGLTCGQHIESHGCIFSFPNRTPKPNITKILYSNIHTTALMWFLMFDNKHITKERPRTL